MSQFKVGSVVTGSNKRVGRVIAQVRGKLLVMWAGSSVVGWNKPNTVKLLAA
jgi:hypothetical protein